MKGLMKQSSATVNDFNATLSTFTPVLLIEKYKSTIYITWDCLFVLGLCWLGKQS